MSVNKFCTTQNIKDLLQLSPEIKNLFLQVSIILVTKYNNLIEKSPPKRFYNIIKYIVQSPAKLYGFYGMAYIIKNMLDPPLPMAWNYLYGVRKIYTITSNKYGLKVLLLDDSHMFEYNCMGKIKVSANKFIVEQIKSAQCFIDLYLEVPYIFAKHGEIKRFKNTYMANLHKDLEKCFEWEKIRCDYPHLRAHYVDLRDIELDDEYFSFCQEFIILKFKGNMIRNYQYWNNNMFLKNIFKSKTSLVNHITKLIKSSKIQKQLDNIKDPYIVKKINEISKKWIEIPDDYNIKWQYMTWQYMIDALKTKNYEKIKNIYYSIASYNGVIMDIYTLGRMFRDYKYIPNQNSSRAKDIIIYAGGQHTERYSNFLLNYLDDFKIMETTQFSLNNCVNISNIKQPIFSTEGTIPVKHENKNCPPCSSKHICNTDTGRCVLKTGAIGKRLLETAQGGN